MTEWEIILLEAEDVWQNCANGRYVGAWGSDKERYRRDRDIFKARRIYDLYGYDYFLKFLNRCPHIKDCFDDLVLCKINGQCSTLCYKYDIKKGCTLNAAE
jgi:hypothetical protein